MYYYALVMISSDAMRSVLRYVSFAFFRLMKLLVEDYRGHITAETSLWMRKSDHGVSNQADAIPGWPIIVQG